MTRAPELRQEEIEYERLVNQELLILRATELIYQLLETRGLTKAELAQRLQTTRGYITQILNGTRNMTLRTLADVTFALGYSVDVAARPIAAESAAAVATGLNDYVSVPTSTLDLGLLGAPASASIASTLTIFTIVPPPLVDQMPRHGVDYSQLGWGTVAFQNLSFRELTYNFVSERRSIKQSAA